MRRQLRSMTRQVIRDTPANVLVRVGGYVRYEKSTLQAPFSGRTCACYKAVVEEAPGGRSSEIASEVRCCDFFLEDSTGRILVRAQSPWLFIVQDRHFDSFTAPKPEVEAFLRRHGQLSVDFLGIKRVLEYREGTLEEGEFVVVCGLSSWEPDPNPSASHGYRELAQRLVIRAPSANLPLFLSDDPDFTFKV